jgi:hypothetical protein
VAAVKLKEIRCEFNAAAFQLAGGAAKAYPHLISPKKSVRGKIIRFMTVIL